jgi:anti-sigma-K factor RskA
VRGCPRSGPLLGGYVLGALEPAEMEEMRRHVAECPHCGPEARHLATLPDLLDRIEPADVPPPTLSPTVEEAVLDRFARERRGARSSRPRLTRRRIALAAVACATALALALVLSLGGEEGSRAYAGATLKAVASDSGARAYASLEAVPAGTRVSLKAHDLPRRRDAEYELWCVRKDGRWVSGGTFHTRPDGDAEAVLTAAVWPGDYHLMVVTRRPHTTGKDTRGAEVLRGKLRY